MDVVTTEKLEAVMKTLLRKPVQEDGLVEQINAAVLRLAEGATGNDAPEIRAMITDNLCVKNLLADNPVLANRLEAFAALVAAIRKVGRKDIKTLPRGTRLQRVVQAILTCSGCDGRIDPERYAATGGTTLCIKCARKRRSTIVAV